MGEKGRKSDDAGTLAVGCCHLSLNFWCRWQWHSAFLCSHFHGSLHHRSHVLSSAFIFFLSLFVLFGAVALIFVWLTFSPFGERRYLSGRVGCQEDNEGSWSIGVYFGSNPLSLRPIELESIRNDGGSAWPVANPVLSCASVSDVTHPTNFVSEPFLYLQGAKFYLFFKIKNALTNQGDIGVAESLDKGASWRFLGIALDEEWHLSYPYVFEYNEEIYMMPEGSQKGDLRLYRALKFPLHWTLDRVLIKKPLMDASLVEYGDQFWLFASDFSHYFGDEKNEKLQIYFADSPLGPWQKHMYNPVHNVDRKVGARNGGRPFIYDGHLYRVGQDYGQTVGQQIHIFHVEILNHDKFQEVEVPFRIEESRKGQNSWNGVRYHHLDAQKLPSGEWIAVMDGDRVPSGDLSTRYILGSVSFLVLIGLVLLLGIILGVVRIILPSSKFFTAGKRSEWSSVGQVTSRLHRASSRFNRSSSAILNCIRFSTCVGPWFLFLFFIVSVACLCIGIRCFFGGNGAEGPYSVGGQYSQFTLLTMTYDARLWNLKMYVKHYSRCASVREIVVVWNKGLPPNPLTEFDSAVPVRIRVEQENSLNNRFKPDAKIKTRAVLELDDDIMMTCDDIERGFKAWREHPEQIVGFYPRLIDGSPLKYRNENYARDRKRYNLILTGAAFLDSEAAFSKYWSVDAEQGRAVVDELFNCEDILLNFIIANSSNTRTVEYIHPAWAVDTSKFSSSAISRDTKLHYMKRTDCLFRFSQLYGGLPLRSWEFGTRPDGWDS